MNLFEFGLSVFLEICKYFFQVAFIYVVVLSVLIIIEHTILTKIIGNKDVKMDNVSILGENKNVKESKK